MSAEDQEILIRTLLSMAKNIRDLGIPKEPFIVQSDQLGETRFFFIIYRVVGDRREKGVSV